MTFLNHDENVLLGDSKSCCEYDFLSATTLIYILEIGERIQCDIAEYARKLSFILLINQV